MRTRSRIVDDVKQYTRYAAFYGPNDEDWGCASAVVAGSTVYETMVDEDHGDHFTPNALDQTRPMVGLLSGTFIGYSPYGIISFNGVYRAYKVVLTGPRGGVRLPPINPADATLRAMESRAVENMRIPWQPATNLGELIQDCTGFKALFSSSLIHSWKRMPRRNSFRTTSREKQRFMRLARKQGIPRRYAHQFLKDLSSDYLMVSFGWLPLVQDIHLLWDMQKRMSTYEIERMSKSTTHHGHATQVYKTPCSLGLDTNSTALDTVLQYNGYRMDTIRSHYSCTFQYNNTGPLTVREELGFRANYLGLTAISSSLWAVIPFSFVVNWFIPVDKLFKRIDSSLFSYPAVTVLRESITHRVRTSLDPTGWRSYWGDLWQFTGIASLALSENVTRRMTDSFGSLPSLAPAPGLSAKRASYLLTIALQRS